LIILPAMVLEAKALGYLPAGFSLMQAIQGVVPGAIKSGPGSTASMLGLNGAWLVPALLGMAILTTPVLWGEEFGWRGYLQPRLFPGKPVIAAIVTGVIWSMWHWPLILRGYDFGRDQAVIGCGALTVFAILMSFIFGWLVERTGSIWSSSLAHAATNGVGGSLAALWFASADNPALISYGGALAWPPLLVVCVLIFVFGRRKPVEQPS
jgi:membrane protease YdiL (CAAX protease family)